MTLFEEMDKIVKDFMDNCDKITVHPNKAVANVVYKNGVVAVTPDYIRIDENYKWLRVNRARTQNYYKKLVEQKALMAQALIYETI